LQHTLFDINVRKAGLWIPICNEARCVHAIAEAALFDAGTSVANIADFSLISRKQLQTFNVMCQKDDKGPGGRVKNGSLGGFGFRTVLHMPMDEGTGIGRSVISVSGTFTQTGVRV
jgi:hypothetical protein